MIKCTRRAGTSRIGRANKTRPKTAGSTPVLVILLALAFTGCASHLSQQGNYRPPSVAGVHAAIGRAQYSTTNLARDLQVAENALKPVVNRLPSLHEVDDALVAAQSENAKTQKALEDANRAVEIAKAQGEVLAQEASKNAADAQYWHGKQAKALKQLWVWRSIAIGIGVAVAGLVAFKFGKLALPFI